MNREQEEKGVPKVICVRDSRCISKGDVLFGEYDRLSS